MKISALQRVWWHVWRLVFLLWFKLCYRLKIEGKENRCTRLGEGKVGTLYVANHQSFFDPIIVGLGTNKIYYSLARKTLWDNKFLGWCMTSLAGMPVDQESPETSVMKKCIEVLEAGEDLLIFPEGSRGDSPAAEEFQPGVMLIMKRAKPIVVPVAIDGAFDVWARKDKKPRLFGHVGVKLGTPRTAESILEMKPRDALAALRAEIEGMRVELGEILPK